MITKNSLIYIVDDDKIYGTLLKKYISRLGFENIVLFSDENLCLKNLSNKTELIISDYNLNYMTGLNLLQKAKKKYSNLYSILLSGAYHKGKYTNEMPINKIDSYLVKGQNEFAQLSEILEKLTDAFQSEHYY